MKCVALIIGIDAYDHFDSLNSAVKDAKDLATVLGRLKFDVDLLIDCTFEQANNSVYNFGFKIASGVDAAIFYFAGHGEMINGSDCLVMKDAPLPANPADVRIKSKCLIVDSIMKEFRSVGPQINIFIIDACRTNLNNRGISTTEFGKNISRVPHQTFISFSTSPGATAKDGAKGQNSPFASALLSSIEEENLDIELLFKKVRGKIKESGYEQFPWEHTCLIDRFCFNHGQLNPYYNAPYDKDVYVRTASEPEKNSLEAKIISGLNSTNHKEQSQSLRMLIANTHQLSDNHQFLLGRIIYDKAYSGSIECRTFISNIENWNRFSSQKHNHLLRGLYYEIYFDEQNNLREEPYGNETSLTLVEDLRSRLNDKESEKFVLDYLPKNQRDGYLLGHTSIHKFRVVLEHSQAYDSDRKEILTISEIYHGNINITKQVESEIDSLMYSWINFRSILANMYSMPIQLITVNPTVYKDDSWDKVAFMSSIPDMYTLIQKYASYNTPSEVDTLSTLSYIEEIEDLRISDIRKNGDQIRISGNLEVSVHLEYDGEDAGSMSFPGTYTATIDTDSNNDPLPESKQIQLNINTSKFYQ